MSEYGFPYTHLYVRLSVNLGTIIFLLIIQMVKCLCNLLIYLITKIISSRQIDVESTSDAFKEGFSSYQLQIRSNKLKFWIKYSFESRNMH